MSDTNGSQTSQNWNPLLGQADAESAIAALGQIKPLMPFLVGLSPEDRQRLPKVGPATRPFLADAIATAEGNPGIVPRSVDLVDLRARVDTLTRLGEVRRELSQLAELVADTEMLLASRIYGTARAIYAVMKTPATVPGLNERKRRLGARFARRKKQSLPEQNAAAA